MQLKFFFTDNFHFYYCKKEIVPSLDLYRQTMFSFLLWTVLEPTSEQLLLINGFKKPIILKYIRRIFGITNGLSVY